jgi:hydrogenase maturation protease
VCGCTQLPPFIRTHPGEHQRAFSAIYATVRYNKIDMSTLIVGYGNADRQDDGVAWYILSAIAQKLGRPVPAAPEDGYFPEGEAVDLWYELQLTPEMSEDFAHYERICFVDAHTGNIQHEIYLQPVDGSPASSAFTHHMTPATCMALTRTIYEKDPEAILLSVRGYAFGFGRELSAETSALVKKAVDLLWDWVNEYKAA